MKSLATLFPDVLYHSYIIEGDADILVTSVRELLLQRGDIEEHSADVFSNTYDSFTIADSVLVKEWHNSKGVTEGKKICILGARFINHEAQQSLLKMLEEPHENTHFFLVVPNASILLDTIRSRTHTIHTHTDTATQQAQTFLSNPLQKRLDSVAALIEKHKDIEGSGSLRYEATLLINGLERCIYDRFQKNTTDIQTQFLLDELGKSRNYLSTPGASVKMILEHIALVI